MLTFLYDRKTRRLRKKADVCASSIENEVYKKYNLYCCRYSGKNYRSREICYHSREGT